MIILKLMFVFAAMIGFIAAAAVVLNRLEIRRLKKEMEEIGVEINLEPDEENKTWVERVISKSLAGLGLMILFMSCNTTMHYQKINGLSKSGTYTVRSYNNNTATFKEFPGRYVIPNDTLKKGDRITINVIRSIR